MQTEGLMIAAEKQTQLRGTQLTNLVKMDQSQNVRVNKKLNQPTTQSPVSQF